MHWRLGVSQTPTDHASEEEDISKHWSHTDMLHR
jgi:hypothetical protein